jgi:hypothetical protein
MNGPVAAAEPALLVAPGAWAPPLAIKQPVKVISVFAPV